MTEKLKTLEQLDNAALRDEWRRLYRVTPPKRVRNDLLITGIAWKIQERAFGGFDAATRRQLSDLANALEHDGDIVRDRVNRPKPGSRLLREWSGQTHTVTVLENGFEWNGRHWRSLSAIARKITGARWSGPRFFGLVASVKTGGCAERVDHG